MSLPKPISLSSTDWIVIADCLNFREFLVLAAAKVADAEGGQCRAAGDDHEAKSTHGGSSSSAPMAYDNVTEPNKPKEQNEKVQYANEEQDLNSRAEAAVGEATPAVEDETGPIREFLQRAGIHLSAAISAARLLLSEHKVGTVKKLKLLWRKDTLGAKLTASGLDEDDVELVMAELSSHA